MEPSRPEACILYCSGYVAEVGEGPGTGFNVNVSWLKKGMGDGDYMVRCCLHVVCVCARALVWVLRQGWTHRGVGVALLKA